MTPKAIFAWASGIGSILAVLGTFGGIALYMYNTVENIATKTYHEESQAIMQEEIQSQVNIQIQKEIMPDLQIAARSSVATRMEPLLGYYCMDPTNVDAVVKWNQALKDYERLVGSPYRWDGDCQAVLRSRLMP